MGMPQLKSSGRHFGLDTGALLDATRTGTDEQKYTFVLSYRLSVAKPQDLCNFLPVIYFKDGEGAPPNAPMYRSGFLVKDVMEGRAGWSVEEVEELTRWLKTDERLQSWLEVHFEEIGAAIRSSPLWKSDLMSD
jgi:hypothetical protein